MITGHNKGIATIFKNAIEPSFNFLLVPFWIEKGGLRVRRGIFGNERDFVESGISIVFVDLWRILCQRKLE